MRYCITIMILSILLLTVFWPGIATAQSDTPEQVMIGAYINDIQEIDLHTHSYRLDLYVWFRWKNPAIDPSKGAEFMNTFDPADHVRTPLYDEPQRMPDGSLYMIIRDQGKFSVKFPLQSYPFDRQELKVVMEDTVLNNQDLVYVADTKVDAPVLLNPAIHLPGFELETPRIAIDEFLYSTNFGDLREANSAQYSRAVFSIPITRPQPATALKVFLPVTLILLCTALVFFIHPAYIEGRLGVLITALLTLVALQLTMTSTLPNVDYLMLTDKVYLLCYLFTIASLLQVVRTSGLVHREDYIATARSDRRTLTVLLLLFLAGTGLIFSSL